MVEVSRPACGGPHGSWAGSAGPRLPAGCSPGPPSSSCSLGHGDWDGRKEARASDLSAHWDQGLGALRSEALVGWPGHCLVRIPGLGCRSGADGCQGQEHAPV